MDTQRKAAAARLSERAVVGLRWNWDGLSRSPPPLPRQAPCGATVALRAAAFPTLAQWQPHSRRWLNDRDVHTPISGAKATAHADGPAPQTLKC